jgi:pyruvate formate lyase activating enzyme
MIFNVQRFSLHDGEGIRTVIFFKGCPLRCAWCSNPESQAFGAEILFDPCACIACQDCVRISQQEEFVIHDGHITLQRENITDPSNFTAICPAKAITVVGEDLPTQALMAEIEKDRPFYSNSGGGVTLSGGEPFAQPEMLGTLLKELKALDITVAVETCLHVPWKAIEPVVTLIDVFLADLKHTNAEKFRTFTNGNLDLVLSNLKQLETLGAPVVIRIPVILGFNHTIAEMHKILDTAASLNNVQMVHLIPYHALGSQKYAMSGRTYTFPSIALTEDGMQPYVQYARDRGLNAMIGG